MQLLEKPNAVFVILIILYFVPLLVGYFLKKNYDIKIQSLSVIGQRLADPFTIKIHKWLWNYKSIALQKHNWILLFILIFLNNLVLTAFITRILYGLIFFIPLFFTIWSGFVHGVIFSSSKSKISPVLILEYTGYLLSSVVGLTLGKTTFDFLFKGFRFRWDIPEKYLMYSIIFLLVAAFVETISIKMMSNKIDFNDFDKEKLEKNKVEMINKLDNKSKNKND